MIRIMTFLLVSAALVGCSTYKKYDEESFPNYSWEQGQEVKFTPIIEDNTTSYRLGIGLRHFYGMSRPKVNINVKYISPSGIIKTEVYDLLIKEDNNYVGSCAGDLCDLETFVNDEIYFAETGEYTLILSHNESYKVAGIMALGLIVDQN